jgi:hypothetical protein
VWFNPTALPTIQPRADSPPRLNINLNPGAKTLADRVAKTHAHSMEIGFGQEGQNNKSAVPLATNRAGRGRRFAAPNLLV